MAVIACLNKGIPSSTQFTGSQTKMWILLVVESVLFYSLIIGGIAGIISFLRYRRLKRKLNDLQLEKGKITKNFSELKDVKIFERLGGGNFGVVYRGLWQVIKRNAKY